MMQVRVFPLEDDDLLGFWIQGVLFSSLRLIFGIIQVGQFLCNCSPKMEMEMERSSCLSCEGGTSTKTPTIETEKKKQEDSLDQMLSRHKREIAELQNKEMSLKKAAARGSKAEQKAKQKQVEDEISQLSMKLKAKQAEELAPLGYTNSNGKEKDLNHLVMAIAGVSVSGRGDPSKPGKSVKRREKRAQQEAAREQRIQEEQSHIISNRMIENEELEKKLKPLGLKVNEIKPDGHCLYRPLRINCPFNQEVLLTVIESSEKWLLLI